MNKSMTAVSLKFIEARLDSFSQNDALLLAASEQLIGHWPGASSLIDSAFREDYRQQFQSVLLVPLSNQLAMVDWRKAIVRAAQYLKPGGFIEYLALDPDEPFRHQINKFWPGDWLELPSHTGYYRPLRQHVELLRLYGMSLEIPREISLEPDLKLLHCRGRVDHPLSDTAQLTSAQGSGTERADQKYGPDSHYRRYNRLEEPEVLDDLLFAASRSQLKPGDKVLALGCNDGRELEIFPFCGVSGVDYLGVDISEEAIAEACRLYDSEHYQFIADDVNTMDLSALGTFQAIVLFNVLQCTTVNRDAVFQQCLKLADKRCTILISLPNSHFLDGDIVRRPLNRKSQRHDRSLLHKDLRYLTRALYRSGFQDVQCFGSYDTLLLARRGGGS